MSADAAKKQRLSESSYAFTHPPTKRKRLVNRDVLHKVFGHFYEKAWYRRLAKGDDVLAQLFDAFVSDAFAAELFQRNLLKPRKLTICRAADDLLPAISCTGLYTLCSTSWYDSVTPAWGNETARIANLNAITLKKIRSFPAEYAHLLHSGIFNLDEFSLDGRLPEGTVTNLPRTETFNNSYYPVVPTHAHVLNAKKLCFPHGLHEFKPDEVQKSCPHVEEVVIHESCLWADTNWIMLLKQLRQMFPNWRHLEIDMEVDVNDVGYDDYFKEAAEEWSDAFEEHLRQDTAPLRIDATMPMYLEDEGCFHASDLPKFKLDVKKVRERRGTETTFTFTRNEDFGEGRILRMESKVERLFATERNGRPVKKKKMKRRKKNRPRTSSCY